MAFLTKTHPPHKAQAVVTVTLSPSDRERLSDFAVATYDQDGQVQSHLNLTDLPTKLDSATGWMWCRVAAELTHPGLCAAVALTDATSAHRVTDFYGLDAHAPACRAIDGPAAGLMAGVFPNSGGLPLPFDSAMTFDTLQNSLLEGTMIDTPVGPRQISDLAAGDLISTLDGGDQPLLEVRSQTCSGLPYRTDRRLWPVRIEAGALGFGLPRRDLWVSQQQQMLYRHICIQHSMGAEGALVQAESFARTLSSARIDNSLRGVTAFHLIFEAPQIIFAEGAATLSYDPAQRTPLQTEEDALPYIRSWELMAMVG